MNELLPSPRLREEQQRARYRMLLFVRFLRSQQRFLQSHGMTMLEADAPAFDPLCRLMQMEPSGPLPCLLECNRSRLTARVSLGILSLLTCYVFWLDFFADGSTPLPGGITLASFTLFLLTVIVVLLVFTLCGLMRRDVILFEADSIAVCRRRLFFWRARRVPRASVRDVVSAHRRRRLRARRLKLVFHDESSFTALLVDDDATVEWLRWAILRWLGHSYAEEEEEEETTREEAAQEETARTEETVPNAVEAPEEQ